MGSECAVRHLPGPTTGQEAREKASHSCTRPCCPLAKGEGDRGDKAARCAPPSSPSWNPEKKETVLGNIREPVAQLNKK